MPSDSSPQSPRFIIGRSPVAPFSRVRLTPAVVTLVLLIGLNLLNYIDRYILPGEVSLIQRELHSTDAQMGALTTALFITYMFAAPLTREERAARAKAATDGRFTTKLQAFLVFVLGHYVQAGEGELDRSKLKMLLNLQYGAISDAILHLGPAEEISGVFVGFQKYLYEQSAGAAES